MVTVQSAWEALSNSMRLYVEACLRFRQLFSVDREEAICNLDRAFDAKLETFHRLYDVTSSLEGFDYFGSADTSLIIVLRNALHHRDHPLFVSWNTMLFLNGTPEDKTGAAYLLAGYEGIPAHTSKYYLQLNDFLIRLNSPRVKNSDSLKSLWQQDLAFLQIANQGKLERFPETQVYVDCIPIFMSAVKRVVAWLQFTDILPMGFDGKVYFEHFGGLEAIRLREPTFSSIRIDSSLR